MVLQDHVRPVGGRIRFHLPHWLSITTDKWVLQIIRKGYSLPFQSFPPSSPPTKEWLMEDHLTLLRKGAIERVPISEVGSGCYSRYFLIPKKKKGLHPILDLRDVNLFLKKEKFKMLTLVQVLSALDQGDWMVALDLQDAYFHIPILPSHRRYLRFKVGHEHFQFTVLPFGLTSAPRVFTKVMAVVAAHLRRSGISVFPYLDDWLLKAPTPQALVTHLQTMVDLLHSLGFTINVPKSHLTPSQKLSFI
ncbi:hypothetical protein NDU88_002554 [Pleurodeles waltl]|uniref:ribonuclease H n=1 Tax=Pleurodeles waltl TaxID=8319 RepID=A0AAV7VE11_PLEWA|nr:hypothetical protein NDU88_002554 [Pleurodeles waltl]